MNERPELRIGDREREAAVAALGEHYAAGRLTKDEYDERSERAWAGKTSSDLAPLFFDLPSLHGAPPSPPRNHSGARQQAPRRRPPRSGWPGWPMVPILVAVLVAALVFHVVPWPVLIVLGFLWVKGTFRHTGAGHRPPD